MTKTEFVSTIAVSAGIPKKDAENFLKIFMATVQDVLSKGDMIRLVGFGSFSTSKRAARKGTNPQTGKKIDIPASTVPKFKAGKGLKTAVNG
ncbi:MAG: HU family DNA-binding protein [Deltaproteobacteria bacterium]|nr:HU family DNA-binding protein [Deltaproteobacteria bacterium]